MCVGVFVIQDEGRVLRLRDVGLVDAVVAPVRPGDSDRVAAPRAALAREGPPPAVRPGASAGSANSAAGAPAVCTASAHPGGPARRSAPPARARSAPSRAARIGTAGIAAT